MRALSWLRRQGVPWPMSLQGAAFDRYKRARARMCTHDLSALRVPAEPGLVSIMLPVYNGQAYLREAMDSILAQTFRQFELIVVDDGSTDRTPQILSDYCKRDPRVRVITQPNKRLPRALNAGFRAARGEFLTWTSADNRLGPEFLDKMVGCLKRHPDWDMVYANEDIIGEDGRPCSAPEWFPLYHRPLASHHIHFPTDVSELNTAGVNYVGAAFLYRARVRWLIGDYDASRFGLEDYDYWMRVNELLTLRHADFDEPVYEYRLHGQSLTSRAEELGIEVARGELVEWDGLRRSFCLRTLEWRIDATAGHGRCDQLAGALGRALQDPARLAGMRLPERPSPPPPDPAVYVRITADMAESPVPPSELPESTLRVLVAPADRALPAAVPSGWDFCAAWASAVQPQWLEGDRQGWAVTADPAILFAAIDIRARSRYLSRLEAEGPLGP